MRSARRSSPHQARELQRTAATRSQTTNAKPERSRPQSNAMFDVVEIKKYRWTPLQPTPQYGGHRRQSMRENDVGAISQDCPQRLRLRGAQ